VGGNGGGDFGPYRQSERGHIYKSYVDRLLSAGRAYEKDGAIWFKLLGERREVFDEHRQKMVTKVAVPPVNDPYSPMRISFGESAFLLHAVSPVPKINAANPSVPIWDENRMATPCKV